jgi:hypothetical protein
MLMDIEKGSLNEEITIKLVRRDMLLLMLCIDMARNRTKGGTLLHDLEYLRERLVADPRSTAQNP